MKRKKNYPLMNPKVDFAFKEIMLDEQALKGFLGSVLKINPEQIKEIIYKNPNMPKVHKEDKLSILDVRIMIEVDSSSEKKHLLKEIDIEMQVSYLSTWGNRSIYYVAKMLTDQRGIDKKYSNIKKAIGIDVLDFTYMKETKRFHTVYHVSEDVEHLKLSDIMEWHLIELPKIPKKSDGTELYQWVKFFSARTPKEFAMIVQGNPYLEAALKRLEVISQDEKKRLEYTARQKAIFDHESYIEDSYNRGYANGEANGIEKGRAEGRAEGIAEGEAKGRAEGIEKRNSELIAKWKAQGMTDEQINALLN